MEGEEYFTTDMPGFIWIGKISLLPLVWITGIDKYLEEKGTFQIKMLSTLIIADAPIGKELDERADEMACRSTLISNCVIAKQLFILGASEF